MSSPEASSRRPECSSQSAPLVPISALSFSTWNAQALLGSLHGEHRIVSSKFKQLHRLVTKHDIVVIQESHGDDIDTDTLIRKLPYHRVFASYCPSAAAGGCLTIVHERVCNQFEQIWLEDVILGRLTIIHLRKQGQAIAVANVHPDPTIPFSHKKAFLQHLNRRLPPLPRCANYILGDFNFSEVGEVRQRLDGKTVKKQSWSGSVFR